MKRNFSFTQSGNLYGITCKTKRALKWVKENCQADSWQWFGHTLWIDIRLAEDIVAAIGQEFN
jgi:hypothetical protein